MQTNNNIAATASNNNFARTLAAHRTVDTLWFGFDDDLLAILDDCAAIYDDGGEVICLYGEEGTMGLWKRDYASVEYTPYVKIEYNCLSEDERTLEKRKLSNLISNYVHGTQYDIEADWVYGE